MPMGGPASDGYSKVPFHERPGVNQETNLINALKCIVSLTTIALRKILFFNASKCISYTRDIHLILRGLRLKAIFTLKVSHLNDK
jgi:hypothetical protein